MSNDLVEKVMTEVLRKIDIKKMDINSSHEHSSITLEKISGCGLTEFVGTARGHTIGLVIANVDPQLHKMMGIDKRYHSIVREAAQVYAERGILRKD